MITSTRFQARSRRLLAALSLVLVLTATKSHSLSCYCNVCPFDTCETTQDQEQSSCFKSVGKLLVRENGTYNLETTYGCISGGDGLLAHLQCRTNSLKHSEPRYIRCCQGQDYCNENLPDPTEQDDPRWKIPDQNDAADRKQLFVLVASVFVLGSAFVFVAYACIRCAYIRVSRMFGEKFEDNGSSTLSLKADLEKFHHQINMGSSLVSSSHSYSISDDLSHKPQLTDSHSNDNSFLAELTSGLGERMLNQRTMARAVGSSKTDHVGNGRFGRVFRGEYHGEDVAVKAFKTIDQDSWRREDTILKFLSHDNIVRFIGSEITSPDNTTTEIWMFLEYCPFGSLCEFLDQNEILGPQQAIKILYSIINGLNYLHEDYAQASRLYKPSIAHRDIKSKNILMKTPESCCIADFGHALFKIDEETLDYGKYQHLQVGTIRYMAPEILRPNTSLNYRHFSTFAQADLYQYGLILWEVCHRTSLDVLQPADAHKLPYDGIVPQNPVIQDIIKIVCDDIYRPPRYAKWDKYPLMKRLADLMVECWRPNSKARMETLGVKKKLKEMYDQIVPQPKLRHLLQI